MGAAIAFHTVTSIAPVLLIVIAVAGLAFGREAAQNAIIGQLSDLMGQQTAEVIQSAVASAASKLSGILATIVGIVVLLVTASGVFGEMQAALNAIWKAKPKGTTVSRLIRARAASLVQCWPIGRRGRSARWCKLTNLAVLPLRQKEALSIARRRKR